jgi:hypothetical protein
MKSKHTLFYLSFAALTAFSVPTQAQVINTFAGAGPSGGNTGDGGPAIAAKLNNPTGVATFGFANVYIADQENHVVRAVNYLGVIRTFAGRKDTAAGNSGDGRRADSAQLNTPAGVAVDVAGNVYISDYSSNVVRMVNTSGIITTIAGTGVAGYSGDGLMATNAKWNHPYGLAVDLSGNVYIADAGNNVVRKVATDGSIATVAGNGFGAGLGLGEGAYTGDGGAAADASLNFPEGVAVDIEGNLFIADAKNNVVRKVGTNDTITTIAGTGVGGYYGDGGAATVARLNHAAGVAVDASGNLYIADQNNYTVRKVSATGIITSFAGNGAAGYNGDGGRASVAQLNSPKSVAIDGLGQVYIADYGNNVIRKVSNATAVDPVLESANKLKVYPNPTSGNFSIQLPQSSSTTDITITDVLGREVINRSESNATTLITGLPTGSYLIKVVCENVTYRQTVVVTR